MQLWWSFIETLASLRDGEEDLTLTFQNHITLSHNISRNPLNFVQLGLRENSHHYILISVN